ncbi:MAG: hypothetical protein AB7N76_12040 [Planctomycetota bacterium]
MLNALADFLGDLLSVFGRQLVLGFGLLLGTGVALFFLQRTLQQGLARRLGWKAVAYYTGWIGTPIHEASHYLVGKLFGIRITEVKLFEPDEESGVLGYVRYIRPPLEARHLHQVIGTFLMGMAPLLGGSLVLLGGLLLVAPHEVLLREAEHFAQLSAASGIADVTLGFLGLIHAVWLSVFHHGVLDPRPWLFTYLALGVGAHLAPSRADLRGGVVGFLILLGVLLFADAVALLVIHLGRLQVDPTQVTRVFNRVTGPLSALLVLALAVNCGNLVLVHTVFRLVAMARRRAGKSRE